jgi:hypothetical protein
MKNRDVGEMGESILKVWAAQVGMTANKVQQDKTGWDFLIEFPLIHETLPTITPPLDKAIPPMRCLIQVKSTDNHKGRCPVKLSNWWRLVNELVPAFFLVLEFDSEPNPQRTFLVHVDEDYIGHVLKRLREIPLGEEPKLHKRTMQFTYNDDNTLESLDGVGLERAIRKHAGKNPLTYAESKLQTLKRVGYEGVKGELRFDIIIPNNKISDVYEYLVDFGLGLIPSLEIRNFTFWDMRFGIREYEPSYRVERTGELRVERVPVGAYDLRLRTQDGKVECQVGTSAYLPNGFSHLVNKKSLKVRCAAPGLDVIFWAQEPKFDVRFRFPPADESHKFSRFLPAARFLRFLHTAHSQGGEVLLDLSTQGQRILQGKFTIPTTVDAYTLQVAESILHGWIVCKYVDLQEEVETNIIELLRQKERLQVLACALGPLPDMRIVSWVNPVITDTDREVCVPYVTRVVIGQHRVVFALAMFGVPTATGRTNEQGTEYEVRLSRIRLYRQHVYRRDETSVFSGQELLQSIVEDCEQQNLLSILIE